VHAPNGGRVPGDSRKKKMTTRALFEMRSATERDSHLESRERESADRDLPAQTSGLLTKAASSAAVPVCFAEDELPPPVRSGAQLGARSEHGLGGSRREERTRRAPWGASLTSTRRPPDQRSQGTIRASPPSDEKCERTNRSRASASGSRGRSTISTLPEQATAPWNPRAPRGRRDGSPGKGREVVVGRRGGVQ